MAIFTKNAPKTGTFKTYDKSGKDTTSETIKKSAGYTKEEKKRAASGDTQTVSGKVVKIEKGDPSTIKADPVKDSKASYVFIEKESSRGGKGGKTRKVSREQGKQIEAKAKKKQEVIRRAKNIEAHARTQGREVNEADIRAIRGGIAGQQDARKWRIAKMEAKEEQVRKTQEILSEAGFVNPSKGFAAKYIEQWDDIQKISQAEFEDLTGIKNASPADMQLVAENWDAFQTIRSKQKFSQTKKFLKEQYGLAGDVAVGLMEFEKETRPHRQKASAAVGEIKGVWDTLNQDVSNVLGFSGAESKIKGKLYAQQSEGKAILDLDTGTYTWESKGSDVTPLDFLGSENVSKEYKEVGGYLGAAKISSAAAVAEYITQKPLNVAAIYAGGAALSFTTTAISSLGTTAATGVDVFGKVAATAYFGSKGHKAYKNRADPYVVGEILGNTAVEVGAFYAGAQTGAASALKAGYLPKESALPRIRYGSIKVKGVKSDDIRVVHRYLYWTQPSTGKGGRILGYTSGMQSQVTKITPAGKEILVKGRSLKKLPFSVPKQSRGISFGARKAGLNPKTWGNVDLVGFDTPAGFKIVENLAKDFGGSRMDALALPSKGDTALIRQIGGNELQKLQLAKSITMKSYKKPSKIYNPVLDQPKAFLKKSSSDWTLTKTAELKSWTGKQIGILYGSLG